MVVVAANAEKTGASLDRDLMMKVVLIGEASSGKIIHKAKYTTDDMFTRIVIVV